MELLRSSVRSILEKGVDHEALHASINRLEFMLREPEEPAGLIRMSAALCSWLYGGDPLSGMCFSSDLKKLRSLADAGGFDALLEELLLDETGMAVLHALPSADIGDKRLLLYLTERGEALNRAHLAYDEEHAGETMNLVRTRHTDAEIDTAFEVIQTWLDCRRFVHEKRRMKKAEKRIEE